MTITTVGPSKEKYVQLCRIDKKIFRKFARLKRVSFLPVSLCPLGLVLKGG
jgi:hypothetical protein